MSMTLLMFLNKTRFTFNIFSILYGIQYIYNTFISRNNIKPSIMLLFYYGFDCAINYIIKALVLGIKIYTDDILYHWISELLTIYKIKPNSLIIIDNIDYDINKNILIIIVIISIFTSCIVIYEIYHLSTVIEYYKNNNYMLAQKRRPLLFIFGSITQFNFIYYCLSSTEKYLFTNKVNIYEKFFVILTILTVLALSYRLDIEMKLIKNILKIYNR